MDTTALFRLEGHFDAAAAQALRDRTIAAPEPAVILDFSHVAQLDDSTLALLTVNLVLLTRRGYEVELRGLRDHHCRLLEHFGVMLTESGRVSV